MSVAALFIDYDNVLYLLRDHDPATAARFCNRPINWLNALSETGGEKRRVIARRCYASPHLIESYRRNFTHGGFEVIDTPPLTQRSKNGADILMVMDILDYMARYPHIEEYIILSGDADFVPLLHRLRRENKTTTIFAPANIAGAYRNSADRTIDVGFFVDSLAISEPSRRVADLPLVSPEVELAPLPPALAAEALELTPAIVTTAEAALLAKSQLYFGEIDFPRVGIELRSALPEVVGQDWAGYGTMTRFLQAMRFERFTPDFERKLLIENEFRLDLTDWEGQIDDDLRDFVTDVTRMAGRKIPLLSPSGYSHVFDSLAAYYADRPESFGEAVDHVVATATQSALTLSGQQVRTIGNGFLAQGYPLEPGATGPMLASLWRREVFEILDQPDWLEVEDDALQLARWFHSSEETVEGAMREFLWAIAETEPSPEGAE